MRMLIGALGAAWLLAAPAAPANAPAATASAGLEAPAPGTHRGFENPDSGTELIGRPAPDWTFTRWVRGGPLTLRELRGRVVLVRWWTEECHFCATTLPVLEKLRTRHAREGLVVIGVFHPKPPRELANARILKDAARLGFSGPIALDRDWKTLDRYWLDGDPDRNWTSVSFLIDRAGVIRWVHGGGEYHPSRDPRHARCEVQYRGLEKALAAALAEPTTANTRR